MIEVTPQARKLGLFHAYLPDATLPLKPQQPLLRLQIFLSLLKLTLRPPPLLCRGLNALAAAEVTAAVVQQEKAFSLCH